MAFERSKTLKLYENIKKYLLLPHDVSVSGGRFYLRVLEGVQSYDLINPLHKCRASKDENLNVYGKHEGLTLPFCHDLGGSAVSFYPLRCNGSQSHDPTNDFHGHWLEVLRDAGF
jgi:hypothetical protein